MRAWRGGWDKRQWVGAMNRKESFRLSPALRRMIAKAQGPAGSKSGAMRALLLLGADRAGFNLHGLTREIVLAADEPLEPAITTALRSISIPGRAERPASDDLSDRVSDRSSDRLSDRVSDTLSDDDEEETEPADDDPDGSDLLSFGGIEV